MQPHEVLIFTCEEVLLDIYEGNLDGLSTEVATKAFGLWLAEHNAYFCSNPDGKGGEETIFKAILDTIKNGKHILVISKMPAPPTSS